MERDEDEGHKSLLDIGGDNNKDREMSRCMELEEKEEE